MSSRTPPIRLAFFDRLNRLEWCIEMGAEGIVYDGYPTETGMGDFDWDPSDREAVSSDVGHQGHCVLIPPEELVQYEGNWVAISLDGTRILASADSQIDLKKEATRRGFSSREYTAEPVPELDTSFYI